MSPRKKGTGFISNDQLSTALGELFEYDLKGFNATELVVEDAGEDKSARVTFVMTRPTTKDYEEAMAVRAEMEKVIKDLEAAFAGAQNELTDGSSEVPQALATV